MCVQGCPQIHSKDRVLTISAMAALECCAAEKIMSRAPRKEAGLQSFLETCTCACAWGSTLWPEGTCRKDHQVHPGPCRPA